MKKLIKGADQAPTQLGPDSQPESQSFTSTSSLAALRAAVKARQDPAAMVRRQSDARAEFAALFPRQDFPCATN